MQASLTRIILYVQDVERLASSYREAFQLPLVETIDGEWAVLPGRVTSPLHRVGKPYRVTDASSLESGDECQNRLLGDPRAERPA